MSVAGYLSVAAPSITDAEKEAALAVLDSGALTGGRPVGAWGDVAAFSFYPTENVTSGEGGMKELNT